MSARARPGSGESSNRRSWLVMITLVAAVCTALALGGCAKGRNDTSTTAGKAKAAPAGIPVYQVSVSKFTYQGMPDTVPAGKPFTIAFTNKESFEITHELVVVALPSGKTLDDLVADAKAKGPDSEDDWLHFGEIGEVDTGATGVGTFQLPAGNYAIACWQEGKAGGGKGPVHASIGMAKAFTAAASASAPEAAAAPTYQVSVSKFTYQGMPDTVPAGKPFTIAFTNKESFEITHELVVVALPSGKTLDDLVADAKAKGPDSEDDWLHFGEIGEVDTGATGVGTFQLPAGNYAIACWQEGKAGGGKGPVHASIGMAKAFTAAASASAPEAAAAPTYQVSVSKFTYQGMPDTVPAGKPFTIAFTNKESFEITHELVVVALPSGKTLDDLVADAKAKGPDSEDDWLHFGEIGEVDTGATGVGTFQLPAGNYAIACWQEGKAGGGKGPVHASIGMAKAVTVS